jgi:predicted nucleic acid-binding protein
LRAARWTARGLTAYDGAYIAVAEAIGTTLITDDDLVVEIAQPLAEIQS